MKSKVKSHLKQRYKPKFPKSKVKRRQKLKSDLCFDMFVLNF